MYVGMDGNEVSRMGSTSLIELKVIRSRDLLEQMGIEKKSRAERWRTKTSEGFSSF